MPILFVIEEQEPAIEDVIGYDERTDEIFFCKVICLICELKLCAKQDIERPCGVVGQFSHHEYHAALDGTVIFTGWTLETGYVIQLQHSNNIVSVYKHNASLLKSIGDQVRTGEAIAVVGDSGELFTSGPHLHFEIWYKGSPLDPEKHIIF